MRVWVASPGRCGSSAITRAIHTICPDRLALPTDLKIAPRRLNPKGFYEANTLTVWQNQTLLEYERFDDPTWPGDVPREVVAEGVEMWRRSFPQGHSELWKCPSFVWSLPFWRHVLPDPDAVIVPLRNWCDIAGSMRAWQQSPVEHGLFHAADSYRRVLETARGLPLMVIRYEDLLARPLWVIDRASDFLEIEGDVEYDATETVTAIRIGELVQWLDRGACHHRTRDDEFLEHPALTPEQRELFVDLQAASQKWRGGL